MNKYRNIKCTYNGIKFDSKREMYHYQKLKLLEKAGKITDLQLQVPFILFKKSQYGRVVKYVADFTYREDGNLVVEDVKGMKTPVYKLKKRILAEKYGIIIKET